MGPCVASLEPFDGTFQVLEKVAMPKTSTAGVVGAVSSNSNTRGPGDGSTCKADYTLASNGRDPCTAKGGWTTVIGNMDSYNCPVPMKDPPRARSYSYQMDGMPCAPDSGGVFVGGWGNAKGTQKEGISAYMKGLIPGLYYSVSFYQANGGTSVTPIGSTARWEVGVGGEYDARYRRWSGGRAMASESMPYLGQGKQAWMHQSMTFLADAPRMRLTFTTDNPPEFEKYHSLPAANAYYAVALDDVAISCLGQFPPELSDPAASLLPNPPAPPAPPPPPPLPEPPPNPPPAPPSPPAPPGPPPMPPSPPAPPSPPPLLPPPPPNAPPLPTPPPPPLPPHAPCVARLSTADGTFEALDSVASGKGRSFTYNSNVKGPGEDKGGWRQASGSADSWKCPVDTTGTRT